MNSKKDSMFAKLTVVLLLGMLVVPTAALAAKVDPNVHKSLVGPTGYCQNYDLSAGTAVGKVQITTSTAVSPGFHPVSVDIRLGDRSIPSGIYQVWLVDLNRDGSGHVIGCAASPFDNVLTVETGRQTRFSGSVDLYTARYELQVFVGPIWGPGYATSPAKVDVP
jgi:hypothetical protein